jgi:glycolate oxidase FAD binding subunit
MTAGRVPAALAAACADVSAAGPDDAVAGRPAAYVAAPASTDEAASLLRAAAGLGLTVIARGTGSKLDWAAPPDRCDLIVDTGRLDQVIEHAAGDLVVTVQAGVRLAALARVLAGAGQRLALDPAGSAESGTVGGLIAAGAAGPLRFRYGTPRDLLIGITVVRADGAVAKSGGKVVKNVAGYDLGKLFAGSYGTLGLITEATFRLHPLPAASCWLALDCPDPACAAAAVQAIAGSPLAPAAVELSWPCAAGLISVAALLEGDQDSVTERAARLTGLLSQAGGLAGNGAAGPPGAARPLPPDRDREVPVTGEAGTLIRVSFWTGQLVQVLVAIRAAADRHGLDPAIGGSAAAGVLEVAVAAGAAVTAVASFVSTLRASLAGLALQSAHPGLPPANASAVVVQAPALVRDSVEMWGPVPSLELMRAVKDRFDPGHRMAPGRLAGGI